MKLKLRDKIALKILQSVITKDGIAHSHQTVHDVIDDCLLIADIFLDEIKPEKENEKIDFSNTNIT